MEQLIRDAEHTINPPWWAEFKATFAVHEAKSKAAILADAGIKACALNCPIAHRSRGRTFNPEVISTCLRFLGSAKCQLVYTCTALENVNCRKTESNRAICGNPRRELGVNGA